MSWNEYPPYIPVGERKAKARKKVQQLRKKNPNISPVIIEGQKLARTWWGMSWNKNLERYADYHNRIGRGRSYVRHGSVLDLRIQPGLINALVAGSRSTPYRVEIKIKPLRKIIWLKIKIACAGKLDSLQALTNGKFPEELSDVFMAKGEGLFPTPDEIELDCSCPDWAEMCKHIAATLYGIGARLDDDPGLFFLLRKVDMNELVSDAVKEKANSLLNNARKKSSRVIRDKNIGDVFGIVMDEPAAFGKSRQLTSANKKPAVPARKRKEIQQAPSKKTVIPLKPRLIKKSKQMVSKSEYDTIMEDLKRSRKELAEVQQATLKLSSISLADQVSQIVNQSKNGITVPEVAKKMNIDRQTIYNLIYRLSKKNRIRKISRGLYGPA